MTWHVMILPSQLGPNTKKESKIISCIKKSYFKSKGHKKIIIWFYLCHLKLFLLEILNEPVKFTVFLIEKYFANHVRKMLMGWPCGNVNNAWGDYYMKECL